MTSESKGVISLSLTAYHTRNNIRRLLSKSRLAAISNGQVLDMTLLLGPSEHRVFGVLDANRLTVLVPVAPITVTVSNASGTITFANVSRMFVLPAEITSLRIDNVSTEVNVEVQIIHC